MKYAITACVVAALAGFVACSQDNPVATDTATAVDPLWALGSTDVVRHDPTPPADLVDVSYGGETVTCWPYTGDDFTDNPYDPVNLIFVGEADPMAIRAALMSLDGDRTAYGFPDAFPFNMTWGDCIGNVQATYAEDGGWVGSVVQLSLGQYAPIRFHLRLFGTGAGWTMGGAHFELLIPGTADHQVLSWELAEQIVTVDMVRAGLLAAPPAHTGAITGNPYFREIPAAIYNGIPEALKAAAGLPPGPSDTAVPIPNDGVATIFHLGGSAPLQPGEFRQSFQLPFDQVIPMPFCSAGPLDFVKATGTLSLEKRVSVNNAGAYTYTSRVSGTLTAVPLDVTQDPPVPAGEPFQAVIGDAQNGFLTADRARAMHDIKRVAPQNGGAEKLMIKFVVSTTGDSSYRVRMQCQD